jgi:hypothetical protein
MEARQEQELTSGTDTLLHYHLADRVTQAHHQNDERIAWPSAAYAATYNDDYVFADTTSGAFAVTLPLARNGRIITVVRIAGANTLTVARSGTNTINGATSLSITTSYAPRRLKGVAGVGYIEV